MDRERRGKLHHFPAVVDADDRAADLPLHVPQEDAAAAADVEQAVTGAELQRVEYRLPGERVDVGGAVGLASLLAVRTPRDAVRHAVDPPLADPPWQAQMAF